MGLGPLGDVTDDVEGGDSERANACAVWPSAEVFLAFVFRDAGQVGCYHFLWDLAWEKVSLAVASRGCGCLDP